ncbi:MAG: hypothetical protein AAF829_01680 [Pseudomonadota bacterium]
MSRCIALMTASLLLSAAACAPASDTTGTASEPPASQSTTDASRQTDDTAPSLVSGPSLTELEFGGTNILFAASNDDGSVYAFTLDDSLAGAAPERPTPYNFEDFGTQLSAFLGVAPLDITFNDLAVHPVSSAAFLSLTIQSTDGAKPALVRITQDGTFTLIDTSMLDSSSVSLAATASDDVVFWRDIPATSLTVTDLEFDDGKLLVAGLSTGEFASTLRQIDYPFTGAESVSTIEMFHTAHNQNETRAPIRAMATVMIDGDPTLVAAYTCTPLVTIPTASLADGNHVVGKTVAELGYGNVPVEVLAVTAYNMQQQPEDFLLVINREMSANLIKMEDLAAAANGPGLTTSFQGLGDTMGVENTRHPLSGVIQADNQDAQFLLMLRRNIDTGEMELISQMKGVYFRLSDFVSEYNFPDYTYAENQAGTQQFHNMVKPMEGYPELIIE